MDNVIRIKTENTDELVRAALINFKDVHLAIHDHEKGVSTYILTTKDAQGIFNLGMAYGMALAEAEKGTEEHIRKEVKATRGKVYR